MDSRIEQLSTTTFLGHRLTRQQIKTIQEIVALFPKNSRRELSRTICENFRWLTPSGSYREQFCLRVLEKLEQERILTLPAKRPAVGGRKSRPIERTEVGEPQPPMIASLAAIRPLTFEIASSQPLLREWTELVDRDHPRGYKSPIGCYLAYFIRDRFGRRLGCLMFESARSLHCRDDWLGWTDKQREKGFNRIVLNSRFLVLPWVDVPNLASHALSGAMQQIQADWQNRWGVAPLLAETFVDPTEQRGSCYRAAGWTAIGHTTSGKAVYAAELQPRARTMLCHHDAGALRTPSQASKSSTPKSAGTATDFWGVMALAATRIAETYDQGWRQRRRVIGSFLVILFVLRLLCGSKRSYQGALDAIWENAKTLGASLPQATPVTPAAMCLARARVDPQMFRDLHQDILEQVPIERRTRWKERRVLAVDGAKVNLPRRLLKEGYALPNDTAYYPQGLVSCLYELMPRLPIDFDLYAHTNERQAALAHLKHLRAGDVVVYDRGYSSYDLLRAHVTRGLDAVFRLKKNANSPTINFLDRTEQEAIVAIKPDPKARESLQQRDPDMTPQPLTLRLVRYSVGDTEFALGTTLMPSDGLSIADLCDLYHHRWRLEELYKSQKFFMTLKAFNGKTEIGVRQELYANFAVITATRLMANDMDDELNERAQPDAATKRVNLKQAVNAVCRNIETLLMLCTNHLQRIVNDMVQSLASHAQKERPGRSFKRRSRKPISTFQKSK